ncbi:gluconate 2-dehydrogenase gamma chain [Arthrobacter sp. SLBN-100]|uniref:gluconate 2-dehydrogenase subunit 3 family protein n=1 Tax=Arthrobacter sp. SLBN-100 TaxID=2768450 RepID=UPI0011513D02|nr:gluconate 2-dehydrogenase subunit 3 family protein [Arthrobacter sp. SLBN-100]TQJ68420.1 gluconate 2-dehydrogenase gamma chain [Arthrobacter sp. SLBN-100]
MNNNSVPLFFDEHEWQTVEAAAARIIPTDHDPGAREAGVVVFIDRYLSGIDYIYANPWGSGFLRIDGRQAEAWTNRIADLQERYREGVRDLDRRSGEKFGSEFVTLTEEQQDSILETILPREVQAPANEAASSEREGEDTGSYGAPAPAPKKGGGVFGLKVAMSQPVTDENLGFAETLVLHTRCGFYSDPVYGGNRDRVGWRTIGWPGPWSLAETNDGRYSTLAYMTAGDYETLWAELHS